MKPRAPYLWAVLGLAMMLVLPVTHGAGADPSTVSIALFDPNAEAPASPELSPTTVVPVAGTENIPVATASTPQTNAVPRQAEQPKPPMGEEPTESMTVQPGKPEALNAAASITPTTPSAPAIQTTTEAKWAAVVTPAPAIDKMPVEDKPATPPPVVSNEPDVEKPVAEATTRRRNPFLWLFADLARLFRGEERPERAVRSTAVANAAEAIAPTADREVPRDVADAIETQRSPGEVGASAEVTVSVDQPPSDTIPEPTEPEIAAPKSPRRNPFNWLMTDLAALFESATAPAAVEPAADEPVVAASQSTAPAETEIATNEPAEPAEASLDPITWLFRDLANLFGGSSGEAALSDASETATVAAPDGDTNSTQQESAAAIEPAPRPVETMEPATTDEPESALAWLFRDIANLFGGTSDGTAAIAASDPSEAAPDQETTPEAPQTAADDSQAAPAETVEPATADKPGNALSWLFRDIANLFGGASDETAVAVASDTPDAAPDQETIPETPSVTAVDDDQSAPVEKMETVYTASADTAPNPLAWLFRDVANLFAREDTDQAEAEILVETTDAEATTSAETSEAAKTAHSVATLPPVDEPATTVPAPADEILAADATLPNPFKVMFRQLEDLLTKPPTNSAATTAAKVPSKQTAKTVQVAAADAGAGGDDVADDANGIGQWLSQGIERLLQPETAALPEPNAAGRAAVRRDSPSDGAQNLIAPPDLERAKPEQRPRRRIPIEQIPGPASGRKHKAVTDDSDINPLVRFLSGFGAAEEAPEPQDDPATAVVEKATDKDEDKDPNLVPDDQLELAHVAIKDPPSSRREPTGTPPLADEIISFSDGMMIGRSLARAGRRPLDCIDKDAFDAVFCTEVVNWPGNVADIFSEATAFTDGTRAVVRYDGGHASRLAAWFPADNFLDIIKFFQRQYGPPSERLIVWMPMLEAPRIANPTFRWLSIPTGGGEATVLEVRSFDDIRRSFPDMKQGIVRLYREGSEPVFRHLSTLDLMLMAKRRLTLAPVGGSSPKSAAAPGTP